MNVLDRIHKILEDDTIKNARNVIVYEKFQGDEVGEILAEWNCEKVHIDGDIEMNEVIKYIRRLSSRSPPIGFVYSEGRHFKLEYTVLDRLAARLNGKKTWWNGRKCVTLEIDEESELNIHGNSSITSTGLVIEVNKKGTAIVQ